jgi:membrane associated rhomboid family serine protease
MHLLGKLLLLLLPHKVIQIDFAHKSVAHVVVGWIFTTIAGKVIERHLDDNQSKQVTSVYYCGSGNR